MREIGLSSSSAARIPLPLRAFVLVSAVLALIAIAVDIGMYGPITAWAGERLVVDPVEKDWGFHAEWRRSGFPAASSELLTVVSVTPGGAFDRSGIRAGFAFAPLECGFGGPPFGGRHSEFAGNKLNVRVRMLAEPRPPWRIKTYEIKRPGRLTRGCSGLAPLRYARR